MVLKWARAPMAHPLSSNSAAGFRKFQVAEHRKARRKLHAQLRNSTAVSGANSSMGHAHVSFKLSGVHGLSGAPHDALRDALHDTLSHVHVALCRALRGLGFYYTTLHAMLYTTLKHRTKRHTKHRVNHC